MKYFMSLDMEGVAGLASWSETDQEQRELMTGEMCAAIEGIRSVDSGATILIADSHSRGQNLILERLPQDIQVVRGYPRPMYMVEGADASFDAALFVGYHTPIGTKNGSMDHTYSASAIYEVLVNGHVVGETELNMVVLSRMGIPLIFCSGDDQYCAFSRSFFPGATFVTTKWGTGRYSQRTLMPEASKKLIRDLSKGNQKKTGIAAALLSDPQILVLDEPFTALDPTSQIRLKRMLNELKSTRSMTMLISSHDLNHVTEVCDRIVVLDKGLVVRDTQTTQDTLKELESYFAV